MILPMYKLFLFIVGFHFLEHVIQLAQVYLLHVPRHQAGGILGLFYPWLMHSEILHFAYAVFMFIGIAYYMSQSRGRERRWWTITYYIQLWHLIEHSLLLIQATTHHYLPGTTQPTSIIQLISPKIELHFFYNSIVLIPMMMAIYYRSKIRHKSS